MPRKIGLHQPDKNRKRFFIIFFSIMAHGLGLFGVIAIPLYFTHIELDLGSELVVAPPPPPALGFKGGGKGKKKEVKKDKPKPTPKPKVTPKPKPTRAPKIVVPVEVPKEIPTEAPTPEPQPTEAVVEETEEGPEGSGEWGEGDGSGWGEAGGVPWGVEGGVPVYDERPPSFDFSMETPQIVKMVEPEYPPIARQMDIEGTVIVEAWIGLDGRVKEATVKKSANDVLNQSAIDAVKKWVFTPAKRGGKAIEVLYIVRVKFQLTR